MKKRKKFFLKKPKKVPQTIRLESGLNKKNGLK